MENGINWLYPKSILSNVWQVGLRVGSGIRIWIYWHITFYRQCHAVLRLVRHSFTLPLLLDLVAYVNV
jgi:hypothetical protein